MLPLEFLDVDADYDWNVVAQKRAAGIVSLSHGLPLKIQDRRSTIIRLHDELRRFMPDVVVIPGYYEPSALGALHLCRTLNIPTILMSDSHALSDHRNALREALKRQLLNLFQAAFVAGTPQIEYLVTLGFSPDKIVTGYDVVDNKHFALAADIARRAQSALRIKHNLPERYFVCCSRFVKKKNLLFLIDAFAQYRRRMSHDPWDLVIVGDGPLRSEIERRISEQALTSHVHLLGQKAYDEMPALYGLAGALVFPSLTDEWGLVVNEGMAAGLPVLVSQGAGCHMDLVEDGVNGYVFDPADLTQLETLLRRVASSPDREEMGVVSRRIIQQWDLDRFASGLIEAASIARSVDSSTKHIIAASIAVALSYRTACQPAALSYRRTLVGN